MILNMEVIVFMKVELGIFGSREGSVGSAEVKGVNGRLFGVGDENLVDLGSWPNKDQYLSLC